jgi:three-Cys-motif partner protein
MPADGQITVDADQHTFGGAWTLLKLAALEKYLSAFTTALSKQNFKLIFIDGFAGTGRCDVKIDGEKSSVDGSARIALRTNPPFHRYCFIELSPRKLSALQRLTAEYPSRSIEIIRNDANTALRELCERHDWKNTRAVLFLDPFGMHVEWATLESIARTGAIDVWYLFPYSGLYRQAARNSQALAPDKEAAITRCLGTDEWRRLFYAPQRQGDLFGNESEMREAKHHEMLKYVSDRLKGVFPAVTEPKILYQLGCTRTPSGAPLFALYFAASNPNPKAFGLAIKIARDVLNAL